MTADAHATIKTWPNLCHSRRCWYSGLQETSGGRIITSCEPRRGNDIAVSPPAIFKFVFRGGFRNGKRTQTGSERNRSIAFGNTDLTQFLYRLSITACATRLSRLKSTDAGSCSMKIRRKGHLPLNWSTEKKKVCKEGAGPSNDARATARAARQRQHGQRATGVRRTCRTGKVVRSPAQTGVSELVVAECFPPRLPESGKKR